METPPSLFDIPQAFLAAVLEHIRQQNDAEEEPSTYSSAQQPTEGTILALRTAGRLRRTSRAGRLLATAACARLAPPRFPPSDSRLAQLMPHLQELDFTRLDIPPDEAEKVSVLPLRRAVMVLQSMGCSHCLHWWGRRTEAFISPRCSSIRPAGVPAAELHAVCSTPAATPHHP